MNILERHVRAALKKIKFDPKNPAVKVILDTQNPNYFLHRVQEALVAEDPVLAGQLILAYLAVEESISEKELRAKLRTSVTPVISVVSTACTIKDCVARIGSYPNCAQTHCGVQEQGVQENAAT